MKIEKLVVLLQMATTAFAVIYMISKQNIYREPAIHHVYANPEY
jgi:hypothetical protein